MNPRSRFRFFLSLSALPALAAATPALLAQGRNEPQPPVPVTQAPMLPRSIEPGAENQKVYRQPVGQFVVERGVLGLELLGALVVASHR